MKKSPLNKIGKTGRLNQKVNREIDKLFKARGIWYCEIPGCSNPPTRTHRHKRDEYKMYSNYPAIMWDPKQVAGICLEHHMEMEKSSVLTEKIFMELRGEE